MLDYGRLGWHSQMSPLISNSERFFKHSTWPLLFRHWNVSFNSSSNTVDLFFSFKKIVKMRQAVRHKFYVKKSPFAKYIEVINANPTKKHFLNTTIVNLRYMLSEKPRTFPLLSPFLSTACLC